MGHTNRSHTFGFTDTPFAMEAFFNGGGNNSGGDVRIAAIVCVVHFNESLQLFTKLLSNDIAIDDDGSGGCGGVTELNSGDATVVNEVSNSECFLCFILRGGTGGNVSGGVSNDAVIRIVYVSSVAVAVNIVCSSTSSNTHNVPIGTLTGVLTIEPLRLVRRPFSLLFTGFNCF